MILMGENPFREPIPFNGSSNGLAPIKIIKSKCHIKNRYIGNFMYISFAAAVFCTACCEFYAIFRAHSSNSTPPPSPSPPPFVKNNLEINSDIKSGKLASLLFADL